MPDGPPAQAAVAPLQRRDDVGRHALVDLHGRLAQREVVRRERRQLHRVLEQARAGGEARAGQVRGARVVLADRAQDVRVVHARLVRDGEELVRDGELHVAPGVGEQLGELRLLGCVVRIVFDVRWRNSASARSPATGIVRADDLGQRAQLLEGVALGDPLRAERDVHREPAVLEGRGRRTRSCPGRRCCAGRRAHRPRRAARSGPPRARTRASTGPGTRPRACRSRGPRRPRGPIIAADVPISRRPVARTRGSSSSAPFSRNGI